MNPRENKRLYRIWSQMKGRCNNSRSEQYPRYGGRGIRVCDEWMEFDGFAAWALSNGYSDELSIDRIDNGGNYTPENCRWATRKQQQNNRDYCHMIEYRGEIKSLSAWAEEMNLPASVLGDRLRYGWDLEKAMTTPLENRHWKRRQEKQAEALRIGEGIRSRREQMKYTQEELAERTGISQSMISQIELGTRTLTLQLGMEIASALDCDVRELYGDYVSP